MIRFVDVPREELALRCQRVQASMAENNLDAILIASRSTLWYFGLSSQNTTAATVRPEFIILPREGFPIAITHAYAEQAVRRTTCLDDVRTFSTMIGSDPFVAVETIKHVLQELGAARGRIGAEFTGPNGVTGFAFPRDSLLKLQRDLPDARFVDAAPIIWRARMVKSAFEIERIRRACAITSVALTRCLGSIEVGMSEREVSRMLFRYMLEEGADCPYFSMIVSGPPTNPHRDFDRTLGGPTDRRLEPGDFVWVDAGCYFGGYISDFSRMGVVGRATSSQRETHQKLWDITQRGVDAMRPGTRASEIYALCQDAFDREGWPPKAYGRIGHGLGLEMSEPPMIAPYDHTILQPGMVLALEPGVTTQDGKYVPEENVLITEHGPEILSLTSRSLWEF